MNKFTYVAETKIGLPYVLVSPDMSSLWA